MRHIMPDDVTTKEAMTQEVEEGKTMRIRQSTLKAIEDMYLWRDAADYQVELTDDIIKKAIKKAL